MYVGGISRVSLSLHTKAYARRVLGRAVYQITLRLQMIRRYSDISMTLSIKAYSFL